jgi:hypothetical protein
VFRSSHHWSLSSAMNPVLLLYDTF